MKSMPFFLALLLPILVMASVFALSANRISQKDDRAMNDQEYGSPNPDAPPELFQFAFIIGKWRCDVRVKGEDGTFRPYQPATLPGARISLSIKERHGLNSWSSRLIAPHDAA